MPEIDEPFEMIVRADADEGAEQGDGEGALIAALILVTLALAAATFLFF